MSLLYNVFVCSLIILSFPLQLVIVMVIAATCGWPVLFRQKRVGKNGTVFILYKFRTMAVNAHKQQAKLFRHNESNGPVFKIHNDPRYTTIGKFLAHTGLDEIPQLYNVLRGDMALFGPRPLPIAESEKLKAWQRKRHAIKPGIISPAIVTGTYHEDFDAWMKSDIAYTKQKSLWYDVSLALRAGGLLVRLLLHELI